MTLGLGCASSPPPIKPAVCATPQLPRPDLPARGISAHRGGKLGCPVNTLGAFKRAICLGVHQIELDVRVTADDELVIAHDDRVTDDHGTTLSISESTLLPIRELKFKPCEGENEEESIPTLAEALAVMPQNIWINLDIKENSPIVGKRVAETVAHANRFSQVIFGARDETDQAIRRVAKEAGEHSWISNMNRHLFRCFYVDSTISACDEFIQLYYLLGRPGSGTMNRLKD
ncbi:MAG: glycerophosphodiester phosphodiesterase, partial [Nitrospirales bacterium]